MDTTIPLSHCLLMRSIVCLSAFAAVSVWGGWHLIPFLMCSDALRRLIDDEWAAVIRACMASDGWSAGSRMT
jgi:hypothetical protein